MPNYVKIPPMRGKPSQYPGIQVLNPGKGLNNLISDNLINDAEASDLNNIQFVESGCPAKITGKATWGSGLSNNPKGLGVLNVPSGNRYVVTIDGTALVQTSNASDSWTTVSGATFTSGKETTFTEVRGKLFIWNGTDGGAWWDGTTLSRPGTIPSASFSVFYQGLHIAAGTATQTSRLYISADTTAAGGEAVFTVASGSGTNPPTANNSTDVPGATVFNASTAQIVDIAKGDGSSITGLALFNGVVIIFKDNAIYQLSLDNTGKPVITPVIIYQGAVSHRSIANVENDVFYLSRLGWYVLGYEPNFYTLVRTNELSARVHPVVDTINPANLAKVCSIYYPYRFLSSFPSGGSTTNNKTLTYDRRYQAFSLTDLYHADSFGKYTDADGTQHLLYASDDETQVYEINSNYSDNGSAYTAYWQSKAFDGGQPDLYKRWIDLTLLFRQITGSVTVTVYADNFQVVHTSTITSGASDGGIGQATWGGEVFGGNVSTNSTSTDTTATTNIPYRIKISTKSRTLKFKISNGNLNETFILLGFRLTYRPYSHFTFPSSLKIQ